jgi:6-phosphogluconolactonase
MALLRSDAYPGAFYSSCAAHGVGNRLCTSWWPWHAPSQVLIQRSGLLPVVKRLFKEAEGRFRLLVGCLPERASAQDGVAAFDVAWCAREGVGVEHRSWAAAPRPAFVASCASGRQVVAAEETRAGALHLFRSDPAGLVPLGAPLRVGSMPCHVAWSPDDTMVAAAGYAHGHVDVAAVRSTGLFRAARAKLAAGHGPISGRQDAPHAHFVHWLSSKRLLVTDLGGDRLVEMLLDGTRLVTERVVALAPGMGPRHLTVAGDRLFVVGELNALVHVLRLPTLEPELTMRVPARPGTDLPSHVTASQDGRLLYVAVRGIDRLFVWQIDRDTPALLGDWTTGGRCPRHFALIGRRGLAIAHQNYGSVTLWSTAGGLPDQLVGGISRRAASCVVATSRPADD